MHVLPCVNLHAVTDAPSFATSSEENLNRKFLQRTGWWLFVLSVWPLFLTPVPPFQDLPNHFASVTVLTHPDLYPEFSSSGFLKTNSALFLWLFVVGKSLGLPIAAKLFAALTIAISAYGYPKTLLHFAGRSRASVGGLLLFPMCHNWFLSMGMLDYALAVPVSLLLLVAVDRIVTEWSWKRATVIIVTSFVTWYAHVFALLIVGWLVLVEFLRSNGERRAAMVRRAFVPLLPGGILALHACVSHMIEQRAGLDSGLRFNGFLPTWELAYHLWAEWACGLTLLSSSGVVLYLAAVWAVKRWRQAVPFFSPWALSTMVVFYALLPYMVTNWFHMNSRFIPFLWMACLVRAPDSLPVWWRRAMVGCAVTFSLGLGIDYVRLERERREFLGVLDSIPKRARLLPLVFYPKGESDHTRPLLHAWGYYVSEKFTTAPMLFAHSRSFPVVYVRAPLPQLNHLALEAMEYNMRSADEWCVQLRYKGLISGCAEVFADAWHSVWRALEPEFDYLLLWDVREDVRRLIPKSYDCSLRRQRATLCVRRKVPMP